MDLRKTDRRRRFASVERLESRLLLAADIFEPNDSIERAVDLGTGEQTHDELTIHVPGNHDWYQWTAPGEGRLTVDVTFRHSDGDIDLDLFGERKVPPLQHSYSTTDNEHITLIVYEDRSYFIHVFGFIGVLGGAANDNYQLKIRFLPKDIFEGTFGNDRMEQAFDLGTNGQTHTGLTIHEPGNDDWYKWTAPSDGNLTVDVLFAHDIGNLDLQVFDANQQVLTQSETTTDDEHVQWSVGAGQTYFVRVFGVEGATHADYELSIGGFAALTSIDAQWHGEAAVGTAGDGVSWADPNNWTVAGVNNVVPSDAPPGVDVTFGPTPSDGAIDLGGNRTVNSVTFEANYTLHHDTLTVTEGQLTVASGVTATILSDLTADSNLRKDGDGILLIDGNAPDTLIVDGVLGGDGVIADLTVQNGGTISPGSSVGVFSVNGAARINGRLLSELDTDTDLLDVRGPVTLLPGSTLELQARGAAQAHGDFTRTIISGTNVEGTFLSEPPVNQHLGHGIFTREIRAGSAVIYGDDSVTVSLFQAAPGDANGDRRFDQLDIVRALQGGMYLAGQGASWTDGDWTGNGVFDQLDIIAALQTGNYLQGPYAAEAEAGSLVKLSERDPEVVDDVFADVQLR